MKAKGNGKMGVAVIGCGSIGALRAHLASRHPSVGFVGVCDIVEAKAVEVARKVGAKACSTNFRDILARPEVDLVIVSTSEESHFEPAMEAISSGRHVLVEKPFVLDPDEGNKLQKAAAEQKAEIFVGYTQRFRRRFLSVKEMLGSGHIGRVSSAFAKIYIPKIIAEAVMTRAPKTTPSLNTLTYLLDLLLWYLEGNRPTTVYAQSFFGYFKDKYGAPDATWTIITFEDGAVCTAGVSWQIPDHYPASGASIEFELFGPNGVLSIDDTHKDVILSSLKPVNPQFIFEVPKNTAFLGSPMPGDWALKDFWGPMKDETYAFIESAIRGVRHPALPDGQAGCRVVELSRAIDQSARSGKVVRL